ncbi:MAG: hypothetical protein OWT27_05370 [Firmicutes bacterium]|nr:hypothetical protein [Bacillota bacterium]
MRVRHLEAGIRSDKGGSGRGSGVWLRLYAVVVFAAAAIAIGDLAFAWHTAWLQAWAQRGAPRLMRQLASFYLTGS